ncbi:MAG: CBS domain-containing protein [Longimicrobiales bacterium]
MQLRDLLPLEHVVVPLHARDLRAALERLAAALDAAGRIADRDALAESLERPSLRSAVAVGDDVVLPHFRTNAVSELVVALGVSPQPIDAFRSGVDTGPRVVALVLAPQDTATLYLQTLSTLARFFRDDERRRRVLEAREPGDVVAAAEEADLRIQPRLTVRDIMVPVAARVTPDTSIREAIDLMVRYRMMVLPVVGENHEVLGTVTERDILRHLLPQMPRAGADADPGDQPALEDLHVRDVMSRSVLCISEDSSLEEVASMLSNKDVSQLPVVHEGGLTGMLSRGDVIRKLFGR